jgi:hypothetical protein
MLMGITILPVTNPTDAALSVTAPTGGAPNTGLIVLDDDAQGPIPKPIPDQGRESTASNVQTRDPPSKYDVIRAETAQRQAETLSVIARLRRDSGL